MAPKTFKKRFRPSDPWLDQHRLGSVGVLPASVQIEMVIAAALGGDRRPLTLRDVRFHRVFSPHYAEGEKVELTLDSGSFVLAAGAGPPISSGRIETTVLREAAILDVGSADSRVHVSSLYASFASAGISYGAMYRTLRSLALSVRGARAELSAPAEPEGPWLLHPLLLDGALQVISCALQSPGPINAALMPLEIAQLQVLDRLPREVEVVAWRESSTGTALRGGAILRTRDGVIVAQLDGVVMKKTPLPVLTVDAQLNEPLHHELRWEEKEQEAGGERVPEGRWLVVGEQTELGRELCEALRQRGAEVVGVSEGKTFDAVTAQDYRLDPSSLVQWKQLAAAVGEVAHTVYLLGSGLGEQDALEQYLERLKPVLMGLVGLASATLGARHRLFVVTQGAVALGAEGPGRGGGLQCALRGLGACLGKEVSRSAVHLVDVPRQQGAQALLWAVCQQPAGADLALRAGRVYRPKLQEVQLGSDRGAIREGGCYLLLGGQGELGRAVAMQLGRAGAGAVLLTARTPVWQSTPQRQKALEELAVVLKERGVELELASFDAADGQQVRKQLEKAKRRYGRVDGIFHCAGRLADGLIPSLRWDHFEKTMSPKLGTCLAVQEALGESSIDFVVLFASISGVTGNVGQGAYAAANAAMDGFAREMRARGRPWMSVDFGLWGEIGMGAHLAEALSQRGVIALRTEEALGALFQALSTDKSQIIIAKRARFDDDGTPPTPKRLSVAEEVMEYLRAKLGYREMTARTAFADLGVDSVIGVEIATELSRRLGAPLSPTLFLTSANVEELLESAGLVSPTALASSLPQPVPTPSLPPRVPVSSVISPARRADLVADDAIAIVSASLRFPKATDLDSYWDLLREGGVAFTEVPSERWSIDEYYEPTGRVTGRGSYCRHGAFLNLDQAFDESLFNISPRESRQLDPQQKLALEVAWEALEGVEAAGNREIGVFAAATYTHHRDRLGLDEVTPHSALGTMNALLANRISYCLDLRGPSMTIDTLCSSSLVAIHQACLSLRAGQCRAALVVAAQAGLTSWYYLSLSQLGALSPSGRCRPFEQDADGFIPGEGAAAILLKPLARAREEGDPILGVIRGIAVNHGGRASALTVPRKTAQAAVVRAALRDASLSPADIGLIEAHGTGTLLGDPIEVEALGEVFSAGSCLPQSCALGSVKANLGHLEPAAGMASVLKVLLAFREGVIPPMPGFRSPNRSLFFAETPFFVPDRVCSWPSSKNPRRAGISAFGMGGTNAHLILEEFPAQFTANEKAGEYVLALSAASPPALRQIAADLERWLRRRPSVSLRDVCLSVNVLRELRHRVLIHGTDRASLLAGLAAAVTSTERSPVNFYPSSPSDKMQATPLWSLARRWLSGETVSWREAYPDARRIVIPTYPFLSKEMRPDPQDSGLPVSLDEPAHPDPTSQTNVLLKQVLTDKLAAVLEVPRDRLDRPFSELGLDSMMASELANSLRPVLGEGIGPLDFLTSPDLPNLVAHLGTRFPIDRLPAGQQTAAPTASSPGHETATKYAEGTIAVIAMDGCFPEAVDLEKLWENLLANRAAIREVAQSRRNTAAPEGANCARWGALLENAADFDPALFDLYPRHAEAMDPQQRLLLSITWRMLEGAGLAGGQLTGTRTGVFVGASYNHYRIYNIGPRLDSYSGLGNHNALLANRLSYTLDLQGPSVTVDTLCSSSLYALHLALQSLRSGESSMAIVAGVNVGISPWHYEALGSLRALSGVGRCRPFDAQADGFVPGEGLGVLLLKPLASALAEHDPILGLLRSSAVNHGGRSAGLTVPNPKAQAQLIQQALAQAGLSPQDLDLIEAHGTGTALGDPIELQGLIQAFGSAKGRQVCALGSLKALLGHLEPAAGIASIIKVLLALGHRTLPPSLLIRTPNPECRLEESPFYLLDRARAWGSRGSPRRAGVSSFGMGGANAHVVLEEGPARELPALPPAPAWLLRLSAHSAEAFSQYAMQVADFLETLAPQHLPHALFTLNTGRPDLPLHAALVAATKSELVQQLRARAQQSPTAAPASPVLALLFSGQGTQRAGMWRDLALHCPTFYAALERCQHRLRPQRVPVLDLLDYSDQQQTRFSQPVLFAVHYALYSTLHHWGIRPGVVGGHALGELSAACAAGVFDWMEGLDLAAHVDGKEALSVALARLSARAPTTSFFSTRPGPGENWHTTGQGDSETLTRAIVAQAGMLLAAGEAPSLDTGTPLCWIFAGEVNVWTALLHIVARHYEVIGRGIRWDALMAHPDLRRIHIPPSIQQAQRFWRKPGDSTNQGPVASNGLHGLRWDPFPAGAESSTKPGRVLILGDRGGLALALGPLSRTRGLEPVLLNPQGQSESARRDSMLQGAAAALKTAGAPWRGCLYLPEPPQPTEADEDREIPRIEQGLPRDVEFMKQLLLLLERSNADGCPLVLATRRSEVVDEEDADRLDLRAVAMSYGTRLLAEESARIRCTVVDLDMAPSHEQDACFLLDALAPPSTQLAVRRGALLSPVTTALRDGAGKPFLIRPEGVYLVTGGLGGLGAELAGVLADRGAGCLVLTGRSGHPTAGGGMTSTSEDRRERFAALMKRCREVHYRQGDVEDPEDVRCLFEWLGRRFGRIDGIIHAAAVVEPLSSAARKSSAQWEAILRPKLRGTWLLARETRVHRPDFLILVSSSASIETVAGRGLAAYAVANRLMNALARRLRRRYSLPAVVHCWPAWAGIGMASRLPSGAGLTPEAGRACFAEALGLGTDVIVRLPTLASAPGATVSSPSSLHTQALPTQPVTGLIRGVLKETLGITGPEPDWSLPFAELGMDSLAIADVVAKLEVKLGIVIDPSLVLTCPDLERLSSALTAKLPAGDQPASRTFTDKDRDKDRDKDGIEPASGLDREKFSALIGQLRSGTLQPAEAAASIRTALNPGRQR